MKIRRKFILTGSIGIFVLAGVLMLGVSLGYLLFSRQNENQFVAANRSVESAADRQPPVSSAGGETPVFSDVLASDSPVLSASNGLELLEIIIRLFLSVLLAAVLAFRPRKDAPLFRRNLYVAQTQILLAVVAAALMMIVGNNAARAFAIFAAVSLVRFRTNIKDPKEITVLLISLALGLAAGVGKWDLGIALCLFSLVLLRLLEYNEPEQVFRSMELSVKTRDTDSTQDLLKKIFKRFKLESEVRELDPPDEENPIGSIMYHVNLSLNLSTDYLSDLILSSDSGLIEGIEWKQKKSKSYIYQ